MKKQTPHVSFFHQGRRGGREENFSVTDAMGWDNGDDGLRLIFIRYV